MKNIDDRPAGPTVRWNRLSPPDEDMTSVSATLRTQAILEATADLAPTPARSVGEQYLSQKDAKCALRKLGLNRFPPGVTWRGDRRATGSHTLDFVPACYLLDT